MLDPTEQKIGIIGGGQLGKMMILAAKKMNFQLNILDPTTNCPAHSIADQHLIASFKDRDAIKELAARSDILTYEFEHIDVGALEELEAEGYPVYPTVKSLKVIQDKFKQKSILKENQLAVPDFLKVKDQNEIEKAAEKFAYPLMLKSCQGGYDGKGNALINERNEIDRAFKELGGSKNSLMVEEFIPFKKEISVIVARARDGEKQFYPVAENEHQQSILLTTKVPAQIRAEVAEQAVQLAFKVIDIFEGVGIFCIEMFVTENDELLINEIAPRPHNSGHYSIEGSLTSQFEQHIRAISALPLGETELLRPIVMKNILGTGQEGQAVVQGINRALALPGVQVHIYGKQLNMVGRKMGHLTARADTLAKAEELASEASSLIEISGKK